MKWVDNIQRQWIMLWIVGPLGVRKSTVAQTVAEDCQRLDRLGGCFFFSRPSERDDAFRVLPSLAYQLAVRDPDYKNLVAHLLADDPTILEKNIQTQFKELIAEPFAQLKVQQPRRTQKPLLIILDGLDGCKGEEAQCGFIELISEYARSNPQSPLLCMIYSRPKSHLKKLLKKVDFTVLCAREELNVDDVQARRDVYRYLSAGLNKLCEEYPEMFGVDERGAWPSKDQLRRLADAASGLFIFAFIILGFVGDNKRRNPKAQLQICLRFLRNSHVPGAINPLHALDLLYHQIMFNLHPEVLPVIMQILGLMLLPHLVLMGRFDARTVANFLCLDQSTFYSALDHLHAVLDVPAPKGARDRPIRFFHASFGDFLRDSNRSGKLAFKEKLVQCNPVSQSIRRFNRNPSVDVVCKVRLRHWLEYSYQRILGCQHGFPPQ